MCDGTVEFSVLSSMLDAVVRAKKAPVKRKHVRTFLDHVYTDHEFFSALRLMLPILDKERGNYGFKEAVLARSLAEALGLSRESEDAQKLLNWRKGGTRAGSNAGNFSFVATEILCRRQRVTSTGIKIKEVNDLLDRLVAADRREEKVAVLGEMINKTNSQEMRWIIMIILKDLKLGISEKTIFSEFHPDAEDLFNVTCDLKLVCEKLRDRNERYERQDIEVGKAVRPQLAARVANVEEAWKKFRGKQVVAECKFDGDRIQIHKDGAKINFFSRNFIDHQEFKEGMAKVIIENVIPSKCILDGEMLVWDRAAKRFAAFGTNREAAKAAQEGLDTGQQLCYVVFDIMYHGNSSVMHLPLRERHQLLAKAVKPLEGRLELLLPEINVQRSTGDTRWSFIAHRADEVEHFFNKREEGIILKDLDSKWEPSDRSGKWLKLKPDYVHTAADLDVLIIGGYYGSGRRGGQVAQFLLGIAEAPVSGTYPTRFLSFCKVGTGLTDEESDHLVSKLKPYLRRYEKNTKPPSCYVVTDNAKERPDVWIDQPDKSVILEITSDVRTIKTEVFAAPYGLRFPRVHRVRYDKPWYDCLTVQAFIDLVNNSGGAVGLKQTQRKVKQSKRQKKPEARFMPLVPSHMRVTDVSQVRRSTQIFDGLIFYFANLSEDFTKESLHKLVVENGGSFSMNLNDEVTHSLACERKGLKYMAAATHGDVIHYAWITDCCSAKSLLPIRPKYFLHLSAQTKDKMRADIDEHGDFYFLDMDTKDLEQLFENIDTTKLVTDSKELQHFTSKYSPNPTFCLFKNSVFYFHRSIHSRNVDSQAVAEIALMRQRLEAFLMTGKVKVLRHQWIDDVVGASGLVPEDSFNLRDPSFQIGDGELNLAANPLHPQIEEAEGGTTATHEGSKTEEDQRSKQNTVPSSRLITLPQVRKSSKNVVNPRNKRMIPPDSSVGMSDVALASSKNRQRDEEVRGRMEIDEELNMDEDGMCKQKMLRTSRLVTLPKVPRSSKRSVQVNGKSPLSSTGHVTDGITLNKRKNQDIGTKEEDNAARLGVSKFNRQGLEDRLVNSSTPVSVGMSIDQSAPSKRMKRRTYVQLPSDDVPDIPVGREPPGIYDGQSETLIDMKEAPLKLEKDSALYMGRISDPNEVLSKSPSAEAHGLQEVPDSLLDGLLGDLIPSYNVSQRPKNSPAQESTSDAAPAGLLERSGGETAVQDLQTAENPVGRGTRGNASSMFEQDLGQGEISIRKRKHDSESTPLTKKKVSYKDRISSLLKKPPPV